MSGERTDRSPVAHTRLNSRPEPMSLTSTDMREIPYAAVPWPRGTRPI